MFHTGDLGTLDAEGRVSYVGRLKDMLKVGGENVAAADVESYLLTHPAAEIVQVVGVPDARYIEVPAAFVQLRQGATATEAELVDFCRGQIATFRVIASRTAQTPAPSVTRAGPLRRDASPEHTRPRGLAYPARGALEPITPDQAINRKTVSLRERRVTAGVMTGWCPKNGRRRAA